MATQDVDLRKRLRKVHGGALIYANNTSLVLEPPSDTQRLYAKMGEIERNRLSEREKHLLTLREEKLNKKDDEVKREDGANGNDAAAGASSLQMNNAKRKQNPLGVADRPVLKRKRAKGPNPLSCKKKSKKVEQKNTEQRSTATANVAGAQEKKKKARKKRKKSTQNSGSEKIDTSAAS